MVDIELRTARDVVEAVGGPTAAAALTGKTPQAAWNWGQRNKFPADTYVVLTAELERLGKSAPATLWGMRQPEAAA
jgi:hypothetical protein